MKRVMWLPVILLLFCGLNARAQQAADSLAANTAGQADSVQNATAQQKNSTDTTGTASADASPAPSAANTVISQTSSQSGSPAMMSGNSGKDRDGTNNVQRATMNMVGSPAGKLDLDDNRTVDPDTEMEDRQDDTQDKQRSAQNQQGGSTAPPPTDEINEKNRENNAKSDQNLSAKDKKASGAKQDKAPKKESD